jgi:hypothetical protein
VQWIGRGLFETEAPIPAACLFMLGMDQRQSDAKLLCRAAFVRSIASWRREREVVRV